MSNAVTIKDFNKGESAYIVKMNRGRLEKPIVSETTILSVGRTYVTVGSDVHPLRFKNWDKEYLYEKAEYGESALLFKTEVDARDYLEKDTLATWLGCKDVTSFQKYSLEQLRMIKEILGE